MRKNWKRNNAYRTATQRLTTIKNTYSFFLMAIFLRTKFLYSFLDYALSV